jgi:RsiW-degrading membrane proteinase PrsW (M82 family)
MIPGTLDHRLMRALMRAALIVLAAIAITCALLWFSGDCDHIFGFLFIPRG